MCQEKDFNLIYTMMFKISDTQIQISLRFGMANSINTRLRPNNLTQYYEFI